jgi:hypothetical protein
MYFKLASQLPEVLHHFLAWRTNSEECSFLKKGGVRPAARTKELLFPRCVQTKNNKSFLLLFFKKEVLP